MTKKSNKNDNFDLKMRQKSGKKDHCAWCVHTRGDMKYLENAFVKPRVCRNG